jgi:hypothetical protein
MPTNESYGAPPPGVSAAKDAVNVPSIVLMIVGAIGVLSSLSGLVSSGSSDMVKNILDQSGNMPDEQREMLLKFAEASSGVGSKLFSLISLGYNAFIIFGAIKMRQLQNFGLAMAAAILAIVPCSGCYCLGIPFGIWALVVLNKPEVKASFS